MNDIFFVCLPASHAWRRVIFAFLRVDYAFLQGIFAFLQVTFAFLQVTFAFLRGIFAFRPASHAFRRVAFPFRRVAFVFFAVDCVFFLASSSFREAFARLIPRKVRCPAKESALPGFRRAPAKGTWRCCAGSCQPHFPTVCPTVFLFLSAG